MDYSLLLFERIRAHPLVALSANEVRWLVAAGADPDARDGDGRTVLEAARAARMPDLRALEQLLGGRGVRAVAKGAPPSPPPEGGRGFGFTPRVGRV